MSLNLSCLSSYSLNVSIPLLTNNIIHSKVQSNEKYSFLISESSFPLSDVELFLKKDQISFSTLLKSKLILSIVTYTIIILVLFIIFSIIFNIISYFKFKISRRNFLMIVLIVMNVLILIEMIFLINRIHKAKNSIEKSLKEINDEIYPGGLINHFNHLTNQLKQLDEYSIKQDSIVIVGIKSILIKSLKENYLIEDLFVLFNNIDEHYKQLKDLTINQTILFNQFTNSYENIFKNFIYLNNQICNDQFNIHKQLNILHRQIQYFITFIDQQILNKINSKLFNQKYIYKYIQFVEFIIHFIILLITIIPTIFIIFLQWKNKNNFVSPRSINPKDEKATLLSEDNRSSNFDLCLIRIVFGLITILIVILCLMSGILYGLDLIIQGSCRIVHYNQSYLISLTTDYFVKEKKNFDINATILNLINDCDNNVHFSENFLKNSWKKLNPFIKNINKNIFEQFEKANEKINVTSDIDLLINLSHLANLIHIENQLKLIQSDFKQIHQIFKQILLQNSTIPFNFMQQTSNQFQIFLKEVVQSTIDSCPLPMDLIFKTDDLICHQTAKRINGLWFWILLFMFQVIFGLWIFGLCIYKQFY